MNKNMFIQILNSENLYGDKRQDMVFSILFKSYFNQYRNKYIIPIDYGIE